MWMIFLCLITGINIWTDASEGKIGLIIKDALVGIAFLMFGALVFFFIHIIMKGVDAMERPPPPSAEDIEKARVMLFGSKARTDNPDKASE